MQPGLIGQRGQQSQAGRTPIQVSIDALSLHGLQRTRDKASHDLFSWALRILHEGDVFHDLADLSSNASTHDCEKYAPADATKGQGRRLPCEF